VAIVTIETIFDAARIFIPDVYEDDRGFFKETYSLSKYRAAGLTDTFVQDSVSFSTRNVIRGLHYDLKMSKLVQVLRGRVFDVILDVRSTSPTFLKWQGFILSEHNHRQIYLPPGFANGFLVLSDEAVFSYKHGALYDSSTEGALRWNDPTLAIAWPLVGEPRVSTKDQNAPLVTDAKIPPWPQA
jgi:dTDP-4-dehydrorhamnose 3,5-epimerase